jgi:hypothetical protein
MVVLGRLENKRETPFEKQLKEKGLRVWAEEVIKHEPLSSNSYTTKRKKRKRKKINKTKS